MDNIICLSQFTKRLLIDYYRISSNISVIPNGLSDSITTSYFKKNMLKKKYQIPSISNTILFVGRLDPIKGLEYVIRSFRKILKYKPNVHLIIAGRGNFETYLKECENDWMNIHFTGFLLKEQLYELYSISDIGVIPSFHEQCSYVAIEMMMYSLPIIGTTTTGLQEMIVDGETGLHIPLIEYDDRVELDTQLLSEKMLFLLQHPKERKRMGANARKRFEKIYSSEVFHENMFNFYTTLYDTENNTSDMGRASSI